MGMWGMHLMLSVFESVHGFGSGNRKVEDEMILEFAKCNGLAIANTWFKKEAPRKVDHI